MIGSMRAVRVALGITACLCSLSGLAGKAWGGEQSPDAVYRLFNSNPLDMSRIEAVFHPEVIHLGAPGAPLLQGRRQVITETVEPLASDIKSGAVVFKLKAYVMQRRQSGSLLYDSGYLWTEVSGTDFETTQGLQKYLWVFQQSAEGWQVVADFSAFGLDPKLVETLKPQLLIE